VSNFQLNEIYTPPNGLPAADIVFIHGLSDAFESCWQNEASSDETIWPIWLSEALPGVSIWGVDYPTSKFSTLLSKPDLSLLTVAASLSELLRAKKIGKRPVIFICHSLGGVITKAILRACESTTTISKRAIFENCKGVVFIASPHSGSSLASILSIIPGVASKQTKELDKAGAMLVELHGWYQNKAPSSGISSCALYETMPTKGAIVVDAGSANPGVPNCDPIPIDANHSDICKFETKNDLGYLAIKHFIEEIFDSDGIDATDHSTVDDLEYYINSVKGDRLSLAQKLEIGGKGEKEIGDAEAEKERIFKLVRRNAVSPSARKKYRQFLSEVLTLFRLYVSPLIRSGAHENIVNDVIHSKLLIPLSHKVDINDLFNIADVHSAIYYLTGNCHIDWAKNDD
jgi:pimeloyl-ACP methyl ester carboxylesterase